jgi:hypothetical protein
MIARTIHEEAIVTAIESTPPPGPALGARGKVIAVRRTSRLEFRGGSYTSLWGVTEDSEEVRTSWGIH